MHVSERLKLGGPIIIALNGVVLTTNNQIIHKQYLLRMFEESEHIILDNLKA
jgi:hypothetical protein